MIFLIFLLVSQVVQAEENTGRWSDFRIVGGKTIAIEKYPFMVSLSGPIQNEAKLRTCAGSILSKKWAITAAHCYESVIDSKMCFRAGSTSSEMGGSIHCTDKLHIHENFDFVYVPEKDVRTSSNDIALVEVTPDFPLDGVKVVPATLPPDHLEAPPGMVGTILGWGRLGESKPISTDLQAADVFIISQNECKRWYPFYYIDDQHICGRFPDQWVGFCRGDSGGPLLVEGYLMGIASWTDRNCGDPTKPNVFAFVPYFRDWINKITGL